MSVQNGDTIEWNYYFSGVLDTNKTVIMEITNVDRSLGLVKGNVNWSNGIIIEPQANLLIYSGSMITYLGQINMLGIGGIGLIPSPIQLSELDIIFSNYTIDGNTITEVSGSLKWELTFNNEGILTTGILYVSGTENYRLSLNSPSGSVVSFGYSSIIFLSIGIIITIVMRKRKFNKIK
ncbi:MAG: hypothetical protein ACFFEY_12345 [Candidatus Thorarchaeota archaeon]